MAGGNRKIGGATGNTPFPTDSAGRGSWSREEQYRFKLRGQWPVFPVGEIGLNTGEYFYAISSGVVTGSGTEFIPAHGANVSRTTAEPLFQVIGTNFGIGDGAANFGVPDVSDDLGYLKPDINVVSGTYSSGTLPQHSHQFFKPQSNSPRRLDYRANESQASGWWSSYDGSLNNGRFKETVCCITNTEMDYPVGSIIQIMLPCSPTLIATLLPDNVVIASGQPISRTTYSNLFGKIGTDYGVGNGSTTFNIPDYRGVFIRGIQGSEGGLRIQPSGAITGSGYFESDFHRHRHRINQTLFTNVVQQQTLDGGAPIDPFGEAYGPPSSLASNIGGAVENRPPNITALNCVVIDTFAI